MYSCLRPLSLVVLCFVLSACAPRTVTSGPTQARAQSQTLFFFFETGRTAFGTWGAESTPVQFYDDADPVAQQAFTARLTDMSNRPGARVCAVVPTYDFKGKLHQQLYDLLTLREKTLPGIWQQQSGIRTIFKIAPEAPVTAKQGEDFCRLLDRRAAELGGR